MKKNKNKTEKKNQKKKQKKKLVFVFAFFTLANFVFLVLRFFLSLRWYVPNRPCVVYQINH
ncbi:hypothetical protein Hanom_Chr05g00389601 [Helianthus anomalus]